MYIEAFTLPTLDLRTYNVMAQCVHNDIAGFRYRWTRETPEPRLKDINWVLLGECVEDLVVEICQHFDNTPFDLNKFLKSKTGSVGVRYARAVRDTAHRGFEYERDSKIKGFSKIEGYDEEGYVEDEDVKKPRGILGRDPKFNLQYARYVPAFEEALGCVRGVTSCLDHKECGMAFRDLKEGECLVNGDDNVVRGLGGFIECDGTSYESSQRDIVLAIEYLVMSEVFRRCGYGNNSEFLDLFSAKCWKYVETSNGFRIVFDWCRGSGDLDTKTGNTLINKITTEYFMRHNKGRDVGQYENTFALFGLDMKIIVRRDYHDVSYCSGKFIKVNALDYVYVQDLTKLMSKIGKVINADFSEKLGTYYKSLGYMYMVLYKDIPIYEDLGRWLMTCSGERVDIEVSTQSYGLQQAYKWHKKRSEEDFKNACKPNQPGPFNGSFDTGLIRRELVMSFDVSCAELEALDRTFQTTLSFPPEFNKPHKVKRNARAPEYDVGVVANYSLPRLPKMFRRYRNRILQLVKRIPIPR